MRERNLNTIELFIASGAETKSIREKIVLGLKELSRQHDNSGFDFQVRWWEEESAAIQPSGRSQDGYNLLIDRCDMVAVILQNTLGKYTTEEFDYARKLSRPPKIAVYTLPAQGNNDARYEFLKRLRGMEYFPCEVNNDDQLLNKIIGELLFIKDAYANAEETIDRLNPDSDLTQEAVTLFKQGDYRAASAALDIDEIRKRAKDLSAKQKEVAEAFVLKAQLELTDVTNKARFEIAEKLFDEAIAASRAPEILFEYARYCQNQNMFKQADGLYTETLALFRKLAAENPAAYTPNVAVTLNNLGALHWNTCEYVKAEKEYTEALGIRRKLASENPAAYAPDVAMTLNNLAMLHDVNDKYETAEKEYTEALGLYRQLADENPAAYVPYVATTLNNLGLLHWKTIKYAKAEEEYTESLVIRRKLAAENPAAYMPDVAQTLSNLAGLHWSTKQAKAEEEVTEALEIYRKLAAENPAAYTPDVAMTLNNLAALHRSTNEYAKAKEEHTEALTLITPFYQAYPGAYQNLYDKITSGLAKCQNAT